MPVYLSPTEHSVHLKRLGRISPLCEQNGCDVLSITPTARIGFQRKEVSDLFSSLLDGRLAKELLQIADSSLLTHAVLILEGRFDWTTEGQSTNQYTSITRRGFRSLITSVQLSSIIVHFTDSPSDTADLITNLSTYLSKPKHSSLSRRPNSTSQWGRTTSRGFASHLLQSLPGVGPELADRIYNHFKTVPIRWTVTSAELQVIPGIGKKRAEELIACFGTVDD